MSFEWTDESRADVVERYNKAEPTADNSMEIVNQIAEDIGATPNGVRLILIKADAYIKKEPTSSSSSSGSSGGSKRVSKDEAHGSLREAMEAKNLEIDDDIITKLTGKAAVYFAAQFNAI